MANVITGTGEPAVALDMYETAVRAEMVELRKLTEQALRVRKPDDPRPWEGVYPCLANVSDRLAVRGYKRDLIAEAFFHAARAGTFV